MNQNFKDNKSLVSFFLPETNISMKEIYEILLKEKIEEIMYPKEYSLKGFNFSLFSRDDNFFYLLLKGKKFPILLTPIKIRFLLYTKFIEYDLFSQEQFINLSNELNLEYPQIVYTKDNITYKSNYIFSSYINLYKEATNIYIKNKMNFKKITKEEFTSLKSKDCSGFLGKYFNSHSDFDKNYYLYFPDEDKNIENFFVINSSKRQEVSKHFKTYECSAIRKYFGADKIGKSITLIGTFKYCFDHENFGTLYINCKTLEFYSWRNPDICKQILIDEIIYLFFGDYETYISAFDYIENFELVANVQEKNFWSLLEGLLDFLKQNKIFFISFDQYDHKVDPFEQLISIWTDLFKKKKFYISILTVSPVNDQEIIEYKVNSLLGEQDYNPFRYFWYIEINDLINSEILKFDNIELDEKLEYLGRNINNYYLINSEFKKNNSIDAFIEQKKKDITKSLYDFFEIKDKSWILSPRIYNFLIISVNKKYSFNEFKNIYNNIPFEYFEANKGVDDNENYIELNYRYLIVNDIFDEIYSEIVLTENIYNNIFESGGAKGELFEKRVIQHFTPSEQNKYEVNFFGKFIVSEIYSVDKFVPKINQKLKLENPHIINIGIKPFLLKQKNFYGKAFDIVIVEYFGNQSVFFCFQITGHKNKINLMEYKELEGNIKRMIKYMENYFNFEIYSVYFSYIFDYSKIAEKKIVTMCETLEKRNIKFIFFDTNSKLSYDKNSNPIFELKNNMNEFIISTGNKIENQLYKLNNNQRNEIIKIFKNIYKCDKVSFELFYISYLNMDIMYKYPLFCISQIRFNNNNELIMLYPDNKEYKSAILFKKGKAIWVDNNIFGKALAYNFDYYRIIIN